MKIWGLLGLFGVTCACGPGADSASSDAVDAAREQWVRQEVSEHNAWLSEELRAEKYGEMADSAWSFFRGTNHLYWADFAGDERLSEFGASTFLQGDLHVGNFGSFHDGEERVVYDVNDFDEGVIGDYQLDLWRGAASIVLVGRDLELADSDCHAAVDAFSKGYLDASEDFIDNDDELAAVVVPENAEGPLADFLADVVTKTREKMLDKWTVVENGARILQPDHEDLAPVDEREALIEAFATYAWDADYFAVKDVALRLHAGVGSLGVPRYYVLVEGPTTSLEDDVILDVKYIAPATGAEHLGASVFATEAERSVAAQTALLASPDVHLGWFMFEGGSYVVRERSPYKDDIALDEIEGVTALASLARQWGAILAAAHARADNDFDEKLVPSSIEETVDKLTNNRRTKFYGRVWAVAKGYASQVEKDWQAFLPLAQ